MFIPCSGQIENCLGGMEVAEKSCYEGHSGALCEQCDVKYYLLLSELKC